MSETAPLSDDDLRILVINPGAVWAPGVQQRVARELQAARARVAELEAAQRPPLGYVVLAKRMTPTIVPRYTTAGGIWDEREPVDNHRGWCEDSAAADPEKFGNDVEYTAAHRVRQQVGSRR
ncbi:hypothetical protein AB0M22_09265 [Nocardia sp. NPDC051756]|uniref:hypothetical protein n=1 Tax=Nocardia sp. NPDC051756 TaxID=3154751 RepID=UPI00343AE945